MGSDIIHLATYHQIAEAVAHHSKAAGVVALTHLHAAGTQTDRLYECNSSEAGKMEVKNY